MNSKVVSLENKIGEGRYREVYRDGLFVVKTVKPVIEKDYGLFRISFPTLLYTKYKFGVPDFNQHEYQNYLRVIVQVPDEMKDSFAKIYDVEKHGKHSLSIGELVVNADSSVAKSLRDHGPVQSAVFWERLQRLEDLFLSKDIPFFDIRAHNILVKELSDGSLIPVLASYKRVGARTYLFQLDLLFKSGRARKIKKLFSRIREEYNPKTPSKT